MYHSVWKNTDRLGILFNIQTVFKFPDKSGRAILAVHYQHLCVFFASSRFLSTRRRPC